jgi:hypothetical protein
MKRNLNDTLFSYYDFYGDYIENSEDEDAILLSLDVTKELDGKEGEKDCREWIVPERQLQHFRSNWLKEINYNQRTSFSSPFLDIALSVLCHLICTEDWLSLMQTCYHFWTGAVKKKLETLRWRTTQFNQLFLYPSLPQSYQRMTFGSNVTLIIDDSPYEGKITQPIIKYKPNMTFGGIYVKSHNLYLINHYPYTGPLIERILMITRENYWHISEIMGIYEFIEGYGKGEDLCKLLEARLRNTKFKSLIQ